MARFTQVSPVVYSLMSFISIISIREWAVEKLKWEFPSEAVREGQNIREEIIFTWIAEHVAR